MIGLVKHYRRSPDQLTQDEIHAYLLHLEKRGLSPSSRNVAISGMKFFYHQMLPNPFSAFGGGVACDRGRTHPPCSTRTIVS